ncbi:hypothetical protein [Nocardia asteroides]|uniref:hypothetical protein n=1 Tax=Nocardia asteroides TaxID=1824 RepID=UPI001E46A158|nr:hypothetical protein [Nocardia asteroides]UGT62591.1 hypothetical protein LTT61_04395 [Nocardia asteroides]
MRIRTLLAAPVLAAALAAPGMQAAAAQPSDTVYFSYGGSNCAIRATGDVGCDIPGGTNLFGFTVHDLAIDLPFLPAHPTFGLFGPHGRAGSAPIDGTLSNGGASCTGGGRGALFCTAKGHSFSFGWSGTQIS